MQYYQFILSFYLKQHQKAQIKSKTVAKFLYLIFYFQLLGLLLNTNIDFQQQITDQVSINFLLTFQFVREIGRPYQSLLQNQTFRLYSFIIPTTLFYFISFGLMKKIIQKYVVRNKNLKKKDQHISNYNKLISIVYQIYFYVFALYSFDLQIAAIVEVTNGTLFTRGEILAFNVVQTVILLLFVQMNILSSESIQFQNSPLQVTQLKKYSFFNTILIILSLYFKALNTTWNYIPQQIMNIIILLYYLQDEVKKKGCLLNLSSITILSFGFLYNLTTLILASSTNKYQIGIIFVLCPFFINLLICVQRNFNMIIIAKQRSIEQIYQNLTILANEKEKYKQKHSFQYLILQQKQTNIKQDLFLTELFLFNNKIIKSTKTKKSFWYQKYILIKYYLEDYTETISLIYHFNQQQYYSEQAKQYFRTSIQFSYLQQIQLKMIKSEVCKLLYFNITKNGENSQSNLTKQYIEYKIKIENSQDVLKNIFMQKSQLYESILSCKITKENELFRSAIRLTKQALNLEKQLKAEAVIHKTYKIIQLVTILLVDFFNNILQAEIIRFSFINNEDLKENVLEEMSYISLQLQDDMTQMKIQHFSQDFFKNIGYKKNLKELQVLEFNSFFADEFLETHQNLVSNFLSTGICNKIGQDFDVIIRGFENNYYCITLQLQIQPLLSNHIQIFTFTKILENQPKSIFIKNEQIIGQTNSLITFLNQNNVYFNSKQLYLMDINKLIQNYKKIPLQKIVKIQFSNLVQEFLGIQINRNNLYEISILDQNGMYDISEDEDLECGSQMFEPNQESFVAIPMSQYFEEVLPPFSEEKRDKTDQVLLKDDTKKDFKTFVRSIKEYDSQSVQGNCQNHSKKSIKVDKEDMVQADDKASSKFSKGFLDTSIYYSKYNKLQLFLDQQNLSFIYICIFLFLVVLIINCTFYTVSIVRLVPNLDESKNDQDLLVIKSNFLTPVHDCIVSQTAFVSYFMLFAYKAITYQVANEKSQFSRDSIDKSYELLKESYTTQLNNQNLLEFFYDESIEMNQQNNNDLEMTNLPLNIALFNYLKSQFFVIRDNLKLDLATVANLVASNDYTYVMANILTVDNYFDKLSDFVVNLTINTAITNENNGTKLFLKLTFLQSLFILLAFSYIFRIYSMNNKYFSLYTDLNQFALQEELKKLNSIINLLQKDNAYKNYNYDIVVLEKKILSNSLPYNLKCNQLRLQNQKYKPPRIKILLLQILLILFFTLPQIFIQQIDSTFYEKYEQTSLWIEKVSQTSAALAAIYSYREINYQISSKSSYYSFFTEDARLKQNEKVLGELAKIEDFINQFPFLDYSLLIMDDSTNAMIQKIQSENICLFVNKFDISLAQEHCDSIYNGVAKLGIYNTISTIYNQLSLEYENTKGFQAQLRASMLPFEELEISLITSNAILSISDYLMQAIVNEADRIILIHNIFTVIYFVINFILLFVLLLIIRPYLIKQQYLVKRMVYLIPQYQFYLDQKFDTDFRLLIIQMK